jgi:putative DNA primase/helicase
LSVRKELPFKQVNDLALGQYPSILFRWFPNGKLVERDKEFAIGDLSGAPSHKKKGHGSVKVNVKTGEWAEMNGGEPRGGDPVSLYAWAFCGGKMGEACKMLGAELGVPGCEPPKGAEIVPFKPKNPPREAKKADWQPIIPPPDGVKEPTEILAKWDHVYLYRDQSGKLLRYVLRDDKTETAPKKVLPLTYGILDGKPNWHWKGPADPKGLYGLERLDCRPVLLQEGEKKTDDVQKKLTSHACLSLTGGTGGVNCNDLKPLADQTVICSPDNDGGGKDTMRKIAAQLRKLGAKVSLLDHTGQPDKWDLGNAATGEMPDGSKVDPWDFKRLAEYIEMRKVPNLDEPDSGDVDIDDVDLGEPTNDDSEWLKDPEELATDTEGVIPLGHDNGIFYYLSRGTGQIHPLTPARHTELELTALADPLTFWEKCGIFQKNDKEGWDAKKSARWMMFWCRRRGIYNPDRARGRGAWLDEDRDGNIRAVLNLGNRLLVGGESLPLKLPGSRYFYEAALPLNYVEAPPLTKEQAGELAELCKLFSWEKPIYGILIAGWLAVAPICGALFWRPAIWITGGSGSGKSTLEKLIMQPALGGIGLFRKGGSTEAGIRQELGRDALPVMFDEAEAESLKSKNTLQGLLELNRQSSSDGGAKIVKGTQNQSGAKTYHVKSCFAFSSINPTLDHMADESRVSVLELTSHNAEARAGFDAFVDRINRTMTPEFCAGFVARSVWLMPVILENARTFSKAVAVHLGSSRVGDQIGTLLAGAFSEISDNRVSFEAARKWVEEQDWSDTTSADATPDERRLLNHLIQTRVRLDLDDKVEDLTIAEVIKLASGENGEAVAAFANNELKRNGIAWDDERNGVWIANDHKALKKHLEGTPWSSQWARALRRLPGAEARARDAAPIRFKREEGKKGEERARATFLPLELIE